MNQYAGYDFTDFGSFSPPYGWQATDSEIRSAENLGGRIGPGGGRIDPLIDPRGIQYGNIDPSMTPIGAGTTGEPPGFPAADTGNAPTTAPASTSVYPSASVGGGNNYYDAGSGQTYVYDSNWNYLYSSNTGQPTAGQPSPGGITASGNDPYPRATPGPDYVNNAARGPVGGSQPSLGSDTGNDPAAQNNAYWGGINGPGLSNPAFYPGGGTGGPGALDAPGGIPLGPFGQGGGTVAGYVNNRVGPLTPSQYNWFSYGGTGVNKPSYQNYVSNFPVGNYNMPGGQRDAGGLTSVSNR